jgi:hypothetical protein
MIAVAVAILGALAAVLISRFLVGSTNNWPSILAPPPEQETGAAAEKDGQPCLSQTIENHVLDDLAVIVASYDLTIDRLLARSDDGAESISLAFMDEGRTIVLVTIDTEAARPGSSPKQRIQASAVSAGTRVQPETMRSWDAATQLDDAIEYIQLLLLQQL